MHFTLTDLVTDIAQNGAESGAGLIELYINEAMDPLGRAEFRFSVKDNGKGMTDAELQHAADPFICDGVKQTLLKHPHRKVALGLPFLAQTAETSGGGWNIESMGSGTTVNAWFDLSNVDTPPIGDIPGMIRTVLLLAGPQEIVINHSVNGTNVQVKKTELVDALGNLEDVQSLILLDKYVRGMEN